MAISAHRKRPLGREPRKERLEKHERMVLTCADQDAFLEVVLNPPKPTEKLVAALGRHRALLGWTALEIDPATRR